MVHHSTRLHADVTEDSRGIWERLHYDGFDLNACLTASDSNV